MPKPSPMDSEFFSAKFDEMQKKKPTPARLFHYTTQAGLIGIVDSGSIWATKIQYLNDSSEFDLSIFTNRIDKYISDVEKVSSDNFELDVLRLARVNTIGIANANICVTSFCTDGDLLSQWRGYTGGGAGYSIGFQTTELLQKIDIFGCKLRRCIYDEADQVAIIDEVISKALQAAGDLTGEAQEIGNRRAVLGIAEQLEKAILTYSACFKHSRFSEEDEWRLVSIPVSYTDDNFKFRVGLSTINPYYVMNIVGKNNEDGKVVNGPWYRIIDRVIVGPCPHPRLSRESIVGMMIKYRVSDPGDAGRHDYADLLRSRVIDSTIPFRHW